MVVIAGDISYPNGGAPLSRLRHVAKAFIQEGEETVLIAASGVVRNSKLKIIEDKDIGDIRVVSWNPNSNGAPKMGKIEWLMRTYLSTPTICHWLTRNAGLSQGSVLYLYGRSFLRLAPLLHIARCKGAIVVVDSTEGVERFHGAGGVLSPIYWDWCLGARYLAQHADIVATISSGLAQRAYSQGARCVVLLPAIEDWTHPRANLHRPLNRVPTVVIFGALTEKDDPALLAKVIKECGRCSLAVRFQLVGRYRENETSSRWADQIFAEGLGNIEVELKGALSSTDLDSALANADAFLALRPDTLAERLAFPTRLVELLKYARPIVVSSVGDVPRYLKNKQHALVVPPGNPYAVVDALAEIFALPDRGRAIAQCGLEQGRRCFDRTAAVSRLHVMIGQLRSLSSARVL